MQRWEDIFHLLFLRQLLSEISRRIHKQQLHMPLPCRPSKRQTHHQHSLDPIHLLPNLISMCRPERSTVDDEIFSNFKIKILTYPARSTATFLFPPASLQDVQFSFFLEFEYCSAYSCSIWWVWKKPFNYRSTER